MSGPSAGRATGSGNTAAGVQDRMQLPSSHSVVGTDHQLAPQLGMLTRAPTRRLSMLPVHPPSMGATRELGLPSGSPKLFTSCPRK
jgi:hypothetical protein